LWLMPRRRPSSPATSSGDTLTSSVAIAVQARLRRAHVADGPMKRRRTFRRSQEWTRWPCHSTNGSCETSTGMGVAIRVERPLVTSPIRSRRRQAGPPLTCRRRHDVSTDAARERPTRALGGVDCARRRRASCASFGQLRSRPDRRVWACQPVTRRPKPCGDDEVDGRSARVVMARRHKGRSRGALPPKATR
jgi:hypothetical protein